jgi:hypothetical protein
MRPSEILKTNNLNSEQERNSDLQEIIDNIFAKAP